MMEYSDVCCSSVRDTTKLLTQMHIVEPTSLSKHKTCLILPKKGTNAMARNELPQNLEYSKKAWFSLKI